MLESIKYFSENQFKLHNTGNKLKFESLIDSSNSSVNNASRSSSKKVVDATKEQIMRRAYDEKMKMILLSRGGGVKSAIEIAKEIKF